jgi:hypothetical protein
MTASTVTVAGALAHRIPKPYEAGLVSHTMTAAIATTSLDDVSDTVEMGYVPANCKLMGFFVQTGSLAASALVYKIQVAGVDFITGITTGSGAGGALWLASAPLDIAVVSKVTVVITTVATTPAAATLSITAIYANQ